MAKSSQKNQKNNANSSNNNNNNNTNNSNTVTKVKRTRRSVPRDSPPQRSSIYRGVTRSINYHVPTLLICMFPLCLLSFPLVFPEVGVD